MRVLATINGKSELRSDLIKKDQLIEFIRVLTSELKCGSTLLHQRPLCITIMNNAYGEESGIHIQFQGSGPHQTMYFDHCGNEIGSTLGFVYWQGKSYGYPRTVHRILNDAMAKLLSSEAWDELRRQSRQWGKIPTFLYVDSLEPPDHVENALDQALKASLQKA